MVSNNKNFLRSKYINNRLSMEKEEINRLSHKVTDKLLSMNIWDKNYYHIYNSIDKNNELNTDFLKNLLYTKQKKIVIPKIQNNRLIHFKINDKTTFELNNYSIKEPISGVMIDAQKLDVIFIPLIIFDLLGHRVGYGKGYYDRFLQTVNSNSLKIGLSLFEPIDKISDRNNYDVSMDICVTPTKVYNFK